MKTKRIEIEHLQIFLISFCVICLVLWAISPLDKVLLLREDSKIYKEFMGKALDISKADKVVELIDRLKAKYHMSSAYRQLLIGVYQ